MLKTDLGPVGAQGTSVQPREEGHVRTEKEKKNLEKMKISTGEWT